MDFSPPPLFRQGPSALARLIVFVALALGLLIVDARFKTLETVRMVVGTGLYPFQRAALAPRDLLVGIAGFFVSNVRLRQDNDALRAHDLQLGLRASQEAQLAAENRHLRDLLKLTERSAIRTIPAEVQYDARDPFTQKVIIDHGSREGIRNGSPVVNEVGVIGQVTRVFGFQSEVTLLTDKDQAVPVQAVRSGIRSVVYGTPRGDVLELRFVPSSADLKEGDQLVTSGLDGVYPPGLPVARVTSIERQGDTAFAHVICVPVTPVRGARQLLVLEYDKPMPARPPEAASGVAAKGGAKPAAGPVKGAPIDARTGVPNGGKPATGSLKAGPAGNAPANGAPPAGAAAGGNAKTPPKGAKPAAPSSKAAPVHHKSAGHTAGSGRHAPAAAQGPRR